MQLKTDPNFDLGLNIRKTAENGSLVCPAACSPVNHFFSSFVFNRKIGRLGGGFQHWSGSLCCVLKQDTLLSINGYRRNNAGGGGGGGNPAMD